MSHRQSKGQSQGKSKGRPGGGGQNNKKSGGGAAVKGGGAAGAPPSLTSTSNSLPSNPLPPANRGGNRPNGPVGQSRENSNGHCELFVDYKIQNGVHIQNQQGLPLPSGTSVLSPLPATQKPTASVPRSNGAPKSFPQSSAIQTSDPAEPMAAADASGELSRAAFQQPFAFQFGSISPGFVNRMQIPARTSSAPPNLDEQKHDQDHISLKQGMDTLEPPIQGNRYLHGSGFQIPLAQQQPVSGVGSPLQFQQTRPSSVAVQMQYSAPISHGHIQGTPPRPPSSLQPSVLHSQQGVMHRGQSPRYPQPMIPPPPRVTSQHLNSIAGQLSSQQFPQMAHISSQISVPRGTKLPAGMPASQFGSPAINQYIHPRANRAVKITHPDTHEELRFDAKGKKSDLIMDNGSVTSFPGSATLPARSSTNGAPQPHPPVALTSPYPMNFYPIRAVSYGRPPSAFYQPPRTSNPPGPLNSSSVRYGFMHPPLEQNVPYAGHSGVSAQPPISRAATFEQVSSGSTSHACLSLPDSVLADHIPVETAVTAIPEKYVSDSTISIQSEDSLHSNPSGLSRCLPLDSPKQFLQSADNNISPVLKLNDHDETLVLSSVMNEVVLQDSDSASSAAVPVADGIKQPMTCASVLASSVPPKASANSAIPTSKGGSKTSTNEKQKGESVKGGGPSTARKMKKKKQQRKSSACIKFEETKVDSAASLELDQMVTAKYTKEDSAPRELYRKGIELSQCQDSVSAVSSFNPESHCSQPDERSMGNEESGKMTNAAESSFTGASILLSDGMTEDPAHVDALNVKDQITGSETVENVKSLGVELNMETLSHLTLCDPISSELNAQSDTNFQDVKIHDSEVPKTSDALNLDNLSVLNVGSMDPGTVKLATQYETQTNCSTEFGCCLTDLPICDADAEHSDDIDDSESSTTNRQARSSDTVNEIHDMGQIVSKNQQEILDSGTHFHDFTLAQGQQVSLGCGIFQGPVLPPLDEESAPDEAHEDQLSSDISSDIGMFKGSVLAPLAEESALAGSGVFSHSQQTPVYRNENKGISENGPGQGQGGSLQVKAVAANNLVPFSESSDGEAMVGHHQVSFFASECEAKELLDSVPEKDSVNYQCTVSSGSRDKSANLVHTAKEKTENVSSVTSRHTGPAPVAGHAMKRGNSSNKKKKKKEYLAKADAASSTGDLYNAYKAPEQKQEDVKCLDASDVIIPSVNEEQEVKDFDKESQKELDDWEDVAELSTQNKAIENSTLICIKANQVDAVEVKSSDGRKYTRDFLLTYRHEFKNLPAQFEIRADIAELLLNPPGFTGHFSDPQLLPNPGRDVDRHYCGDSRLDRQGGNVGTAGEDRWIKSGGSFLSGRDMRVDLGPGAPSGGLRPGQGMNLGLLRNVRGASMNPFVTGIVSGGSLTQVNIPQGGFSRNNFDADRWQRASASQRGLVSSPRSHFPAMHKAENKYEIGKVSDDEHSKQRQIKAILNKLTPQNFDKLFGQVKEVNIDSAFTLTGVISQIYDKALMEPTFCEMYAKFCVELAADLPEFNEDNEKINFKRVLLNKCQEEFESGEREQAEADRVEEDGEGKISEEEREGRRIKARRRMLGNIRFIGELYKNSMLTERIMHECIKKLLGEYQNPDEEDVEALCKLMSTIGHLIDRSRAREHIDAYFDRMTKLSNNQKLSSRHRFMLKDVIDLRKNGWQQRRKVEGPKKIEEVHRDAVQERQAQGGRSTRGPGMGSSGRRLPTLPDHGSWGSGSAVHSSGQPMNSVQQVGAMRGMQPQMALRGFGGQDVRFEDRLLSDKRSMPVHLAHRPSDEVPLTLGPQGGLGRGLAVRGHPPLLGRSALADVPPILSVDNRRLNSVPMSGHGPHVGSDRLPSSCMDEIPSRNFNAIRPMNSLDKTLLEKPGMQERNASGMVGRDFWKPEYSVAKVGMSANLGSQLVEGPAWDKTQTSEKHLQEKSDMAIKEFYSVRDMNEAALCVEELKAPWFHSNMVAQWVIDSFDRKDVERDFLAKLLVHLCKTEPCLLKCEQLIRGLEIVLSSLEDAVVDAPRAPEFFGLILGKIVAADIISFTESARMVKEGGIEPGSLLEVGIALDIVGSVLEVTKRQKGEAALIHMYRMSGFRLDDFIPRDNRQGIFEAFLEKKNIQCLYPGSVRRHK